MIPKFRAWDKKAKEMLEIESIDFLNETLFLRRESEFSMSWVELNFNDVALMQSTGLRDRNGNEIFEGDIVKITNNLQENEVDYNALIIFKDGGFCAIDGTEDNFGLRRYRLSDFNIDLEIIGNIHEHPELLNQPNE